MGGIGAIISAVSGHEREGDAIEAQSEATDQAIEFQREALQAQQDMMRPWSEAGEESLDQLRNVLGDGPPKYDRPTFEEYQASPWYDYQVGEGVEAMDRSAAARGMLDSGAQRKALNEFGQKAADMDYQNWLNREYTGDQWELGQWYNALTPYQSMAGVGQTTQNVLAGLGATAAGAMGGAALQGGQATADSLRNRANITTGLMNSLGETGAGIGNYFMNRYSPYGGYGQTNYSGGVQNNGPGGPGVSNYLSATGMYSPGNFGSAAGSQIYTGGNTGGGATTAMFM